MKKWMVAILIAQGCAGVHAAEDGGVHVLVVGTRVGVPAHDDDQFYTERCWRVWDELRNDAIAAGHLRDVESLESMRFDWLMTMDRHGRQLPPRLPSGRYDWDDRDWGSWEYTHQHPTIPMRCGRDVTNVELNRGEPLVFRVELDSSVDDMTIDLLSLEAGRWKADLGTAHITDGVAFTLPEAARVTGYLEGRNGVAPTPSDSVPLTDSNLFLPHVEFEIPAGAREVTLSFTARREGLAPYETHWNELIPALHACYDSLPPTKSTRPSPVQGDAVVVHYTVSIDGLEQQVVSDPRRHHRDSLERWLRKCDLAVDG